MVIIALFLLCLVATMIGLTAFFLCWFQDVRGVWNFENRFAAFGLAAALCILGVFLLGAAGLWLGGCVWYLKGPTVCDHLGRALAEMVEQAYAGGAVATLFVAAPVALVCVISELITRARA